MSDGALSSYDRGLWPKRYSQMERTTLRKQGVYDRRCVPLVWYWRYLTDEDVGGASPDDTYYEEPDIHRKYVGPTGVHLVVDDVGKQKGRQKGATLTEGQVLTFISRTECVRLGAQFDKADDREATLEVEEKAGHDEGPYSASRPFYIPRAGDVFMFRRKLHRIAQFEPDYEQSLSPQGTVMAWKGTATLLSMDATFPDTLKAQLIPPTSDPVVPRTGRDIQWPG